MIFTDLTQTFFIVSFVAYLFIFAIWSNKGWPNIMFKMAFGGMTAWAAAMFTMTLKGLT